MDKKTPEITEDISKLLEKSRVLSEALPYMKKFNGETFTVEKYEKSQRKFEGHFMARATGKFATATRSFKKGDFIVDLAQPLGTLAFYCLEPESDDGYVTWNFFDTQLEKAGMNNQTVEYPVFKFYNTKK